MLTTPCVLMKAKGANRYPQSPYTSNQAHSAAPHLQDKICIKYRELCSVRIYASKRHIQRDVVTV